MNINDNPVYVGDIIPSVATYQKAINIYKKGLKAGDFYEEPIGDDPFGYFYPDWQSLKKLVIAKSYRSYNIIKVVKVYKFYVARCKGKNAQNRHNSNDSRHS